MRPVEADEFEVEAELAAGGVENAQAFGHHFLADAVAGDDCDSVLHGAGLMSDEKRQLSGHQINYNPA